MNCRFVIACLFIFALIFQCSIARNKDDIGLTIEQFSTIFYKNVARNTEGNFISSPFTTLISWMMTEFRGKVTSDLSNFEKEVVRYFSDLITNFKKSTNVELHVVNKLFFDNSLNIQPFHEFPLIRQFKAGIKKINLRNKYRAAKKINHWCSIKTKGKISNIVKSDDLQNARMVLINAIYFKANWKEKFVDDFLDRTFHLSEKKSVSVPMMYRRGAYNFGDIRDVDAKYIELPYETNDLNEQFSMYIILPNRIDGLEYVSNRIDSMNFSELKSGDEEVKLYMPRFRIESTLDLIPILKKMGIHRRNENNLKVQKIIQKVYINVDREGTEAAAVSGATIGVLSIVPLFIVDKPFMAIIVDKSSGIPLFWGRVNDPRPKSTQ